METQNERLNYCNGTGTAPKESKWSPDGRYVAFLNAGTDDGGSPVRRYQHLFVFQVKGVKPYRGSESSRDLPFDWHPTKVITASIEKTSINAQRREDIRDIRCTLRMTEYKESEIPKEVVQDSYGPPALRSICLPRFNGEKKTPRWSPDGKHIAFLCNAAGKWQIYAAEPEASPAKALLVMP